jgi:5-methyltetrahydropteroyltriglutamate--homocysteine methyltransferase
MKISTDRILTTHVGSMPRPTDLVDMLRHEDRGEDFDRAALDARVTEAVAQTVREQVEDGVDIVDDGEMGKMSYHVYAKHRIAGLGNIEGYGVPDRPVPLDMQDFPELNADRLGGGGTDLLQATVCVGDVAHKDLAPVQRDIANLQAAADASKPVDVFMNSVSPGCLATYVPNRHYPNKTAYREALVEALRPEYEAIHAAGFVLQIDCPDLAGSRHTDYGNSSDAEFMAEAEHAIDTLNEATKNIPPEAMRMHICWLNYAGPHTHDIEIRDLIGLLNRARPSGLLFEGANPRHEHEWEDWKAAKINDDKILIPGVIDSTSTFVEHPVLVAQRIQNYAGVVGRERVIAGTDCGFGTYAGRKGVPPSVVRAKLKTMAEGAKIASERLW